MFSNLTSFDSRVVPARSDLAAGHLKGQVSAARFVEGTPYQVTTSLLDLTPIPDLDSERSTQLLHGEAFTVYEMREDGLAWGQAALDGYVGYVQATGLGQAKGTGQRVTAIWSQIYSRPDVRSKVLADLPFLAQVRVRGSTGGFYRLRDQGYVPRPHLAQIAGDFVGQAERFIGVPYLWAGRSARGIDCSGLVQLALIAKGSRSPRDSDMQAAHVGIPLREEDALARGDLVFWKGHVGIMQEPETLLHANGYHMAVVSEPLDVAVSRIAAAGGGPIVARRRP